MSRPGTPSASKTTAGSRSHREDVLHFLDNLDSFEGSAASGSSAGKDASMKPAATTSAQSASKVSTGSNVTPGDNPDDPQAVLDFLDEIVANRDRRSLTPGNGGAAAAAGKKAASTTAPTASGSTTSISRSTSRTAMRDGDNNSNRNGREGKDSSAQPTRKSVESARSINMTSASPAGQAAEKLADSASFDSATAEENASKAGGWGWGSVWSQASNVLQQARTVAEEQAKHLPKNIPVSLTSLQNQLPVSSSAATSQAQAGMSAASAQAQKWRSGMMNMLSNQLDIDKLKREITETGMKAMQDIMNAVAPPIAEHEVIQVNLSHDMLGYEGVETLVYRALAKVMEQVEGGDLVVNKGHVEDSPSGTQVPKSPGAQEGEEDDERNLNTVQGFLEGYKLAEANLDALIKKHYTKPEQPSSSSSNEKTPSHSRKESSITVPVTMCPVYMRIQPVLATMPFDMPSTSPQLASDSSPSSGPTIKTDEELYLFFILILRDPTNELVHKTLTQSMPSKWLEIPFEENEWVEDIMVDVIRRGVEIIGEEYIKGRMHGRLFKNAKVETLFEESEETEEQKEERSEKMSEAQAGVST